MNLFQFVLYLHIASAIFSVSFFALRYWWMHHRSALFDARWVRVLPHCVDSTLLLSGVALMVMTRYYPFTEEGGWLTEKLFGVIIYIFLGFVALGRRRPRSQQSGFVAFLLALMVLCIIVKLAITKVPLLG
ncbi:TPA: SirB family protein [Kluyvera georgiana]|uniref:SirB2 family protein n=1 Tax=Kluyvera georgiana ATCC 51603 TaxID=1354264 RepID=A0A1B7K019_9ENTR|nr:invasion regulator SirB2 [Kluyvera georgiana]MDA8493187.1 invasion regulator SirB2 [Kluyvera georgiana]OAT53498.1 SirB2 family protein [Kluyvera georgiana ATCC 51603]HDG1691017.1 SirB family protein [Kluyvera georgiana]HED1419119.1 SirB family protein [Kluyvera georgiana]